MKRVLYSIKGALYSMKSALWSIRRACLDTGTKMMQQQPARNVYKVFYGRSPIFNGMNPIFYGKNCILYEKWPVFYQKSQFGYRNENDAAQAGTKCIQRALYWTKRALYSMERAVYSIKRALYSTQSALRSIHRPSFHMGTKCSRRRCTKYTWNPVFYEKTSIIYGKCCVFYEHTSDQTRDQKHPNRAIRSALLIKLCSMNTLLGSINTLFFLCFMKTLLIKREIKSTLHQAIRSLCWWNCVLWTLFFFMLYEHTSDQTRDQKRPASFSSVDKMFLPDTGAQNGEFRNVGLFW